MGLRLAEELGIFFLSQLKVTLYMEIVQPVRNQSEYRASGAVITDDYRKFMSSFGKATINHCEREVNVCADELVRFIPLPDRLKSDILPLLKIRKIMTSVMQKRKIRRIIINIKLLVAKAVLIELTIDLN